MTAAVPDLLMLTRDSRISPYAMSAVPAWLWAEDASRVIWSNATGAAALGAASPAELAAQQFEPTEPAAADVARLAGTLPRSGAARFERLRGVGSNLVCTCSRMTLANEMQTILVVASEPGRAVLPLAERSARMFSASSEPLAVFSTDGVLLYATGDLAPDTTLATLGAEALKGDAIASGRATGDSELGPLTLERIGSGAATVLLATLGVPEAAEGPVEQTPEEPEITDVPPEELSSSPASEGKVETVPTPPETSGEILAPPERRPPLRFVWTTDAEDHFQLSASDFANAMGPRTTAVIGKPWREIASMLGIDPQGRVASAIASRDTWSGIVIAWPIDGSQESAQVELSGLPIFSRDRSFGGYRGFGVCREGVPPIEAQDEPPAPARAGTQPAPEPRPLLTVVPAVKNVLPFRATSPEKRPALTPVERSAFAEIAKTLAKGEAPPLTPEPPAEPPSRPASMREPEAESSGELPSAFAIGAAAKDAAQRGSETQLAVLERLPVGVLIHRNEDLLYANRAFLEWTGYADVAAVAAAGGLERLVVDPDAGALDRANGTGKTFTIATRGGESLLCEGLLYTVPWMGESALMLVLLRTAAADRLRDSEIVLRAAEAEARELRSILDTATDGVVVVDRDGLILTFNRSAEALFGYEYHEIARQPFTQLFAPESVPAARDYLDGLTKKRRRQRAE